MATNTRKLADLLANIDNNSKITTGGLLDATITAADLADDSVGTAELIDDSVTAAAIATGAVVADGIGAGAVVEAGLGAGDACARRSFSAGGVAGGDGAENDASGTGGAGKGNARRSARTDYSTVKRSGDGEARLQCGGGGQLQPNPRAQEVPPQGAGQWLRADAWWQAGVPEW